MWSNVTLDGTIAVRPSDDDPVIGAMLRRDLPVIAIGNRLARSVSATAWVDNDHEAVVLEILDHLVAAGAHRAPPSRRQRTASRGDAPVGVPSHAVAGRAGCVDGDAASGPALPPRCR
ncbi:hypothetical protein GCM10010278_79590 [Streptomyces melanogenes]|nr:hypothetical protein GCM10010278_79590 [Streptomyces melanogenes]